MEQQSDTTDAPQHHPAKVSGVASAYVETYMTPGGSSSKPSKRYRVRARAGRSGAPLIHLGSFTRRNLAEKRKEWAEDMLAKGIIPRLDLLFSDATPIGMTVTEAVDRYLEQRRDLAEGSRRTYKSLQPHINRALGSKPVNDVTPDDVRELIRIADADLGSDACRSIKGVLAGALDHAGVKPNPVRDRSVKLPKRSNKRVRVPPAEDVEKILRSLPPDLLIPVCMLEATGARISEILGVEHPDVDHAKSQIRLDGKGDKSRIVPLPRELGARLPRVPASKRNDAGRVWPGITPDRVRKAIAKACVDNKIPHTSPHKLRHRYASRHMQIGTPVTLISPLLGHSKTSMTLDVYAKVLRDGDTAEAWRSVIHE